MEPFQVQPASLEYATPTTDPRPPGNFAIGFLGAILYCGLAAFFGLTSIGLAFLLSRRTQRLDFRIYFVIVFGLIAAALGWRTWSVISELVRAYRHRSAGSRYRNAVFTSKKTID